VLFEAKKDLGWGGIQEACLVHLRGRLEDAVSVFTIASQVFTWVPPEYDTKREGSTSTPLFTVRLVFGKHVLKTVKAPSIKEAKQKAIFGLISVLAGFPEPAWV
jgi:hypothetical protein